MSGLENILSIIDSQQKENEKKIMDHAENKVREIMSEAEDKADKAYKEYIQRATLKNEHDYNTACSSIDSAMKRKILEYKVKRINEAIEKAYQKLHNLPDTEYFQLIEKLAKRDLRKGDGVISMCSNDLKRLPADFKDKLSKAASDKGGSITISDEPADIADGFILTYGNISENYSFRAVLEAEKETVRDITARELFR